MSEKELVGKTLLVKTRAVVTGNVCYDPGMKFVCDKGNAAACLHMLECGQVIETLADEPKRKRGRPKKTESKPAESSEVEDLGGLDLNNLPFNGE